MKWKHFSASGSLLLLAGLTASFQNSAWAAVRNVENEINVGQDIARPLTRVDTEFGYQEHENFENYIGTLRLEKPFELNEDGWKMSARLDLPFVVSNARDVEENPDGDDEFGLSDTTFEALFIAPRGDRNWTWLFGSEFIFPTATEDQLGSEKWQLAPSAGFVYYPDNWNEGSFWGLKVLDQFDYAGDDDRTDINQLILQPFLNVQLPDKWFFTIAPEILMNWDEDIQGNDNQWFIPFDLTVGKLINPSTVAAVEFKHEIVDDYQTGYQTFDWEVDARVGFFF
jgi:hypothetical protein